MGLDKKYLLCGLSYAVVGMLLGIYMGMSKDHSQFVTHAHLLLVGFVASFVYGAIHKLWLTGTGPGVANFQFILHHVSALVMLTGLFLMFGKYVPEELAGPILGIASIGVLTGMLLMMVMVLRSPVSKPA